MNNKQKYPDFFDQRFILWTNINLFTNAVYDHLKGHCCVCQNTQMIEILKNNYDDLDLLRRSMDIEVEQPIIVIEIYTSIKGESNNTYSVLSECNIRDCFNFNGRGVKEWYIDEEGDLRSYQISPEDYSFRLYRMLKSSLTPRDVENFKEKIVCEDLDWDVIEHYTESIGHEVFADDESDNGNEDSEDGG